MKVQKALLALIVLAAFSPATAYTDDEIRIDLPARGQLKVRNDYGDVTAEFWSNSHVAVAAVVGGDGSTRLTRSPIIIDNRGSVITISVVRRPVDPAVPIHLKIKVPENADVTARSLRGVIRSNLSGTETVETGTFQTRLGNGGSKIDIQTQAGAILLAHASSPEVATTNLKEPELLGANGPKRTAGTPAEPVTSDDISEGDVIRVDSQLVTLNISVIDRSTNRGLIGLGQSDFKLFEDGEEQRIVQFESSSAPFDLVLLIDLSGSTREVVKLIRAAAIRFVEAARPADRIGVITFAGEPKVVSQLTADRELLRQRIETVDTARGDTKLYDATNFAMEEMLKESKKSRRCAIVLMSDGLDGTIPGVSGQQGSRRSYPETLRNIQEFDGVLYTLWLNTEYEAMSPLDTQPEAFDAGHDRMKEMADAGGGVFYEVERLTDLAGAYEQVVADLGTMYSLAYRPSNSTRDGKWRAIRIGVSRNNAVPRGKRGYYAN
ncbi:MAG TPA: VWA domain-containing protein [Pyrinomonadaceae bacterium]|nr:VWA domain-containing protein [Pyrinomonadaceae bacterium]